MTTKPRKRKARGGFSTPEFAEAVGVSARTVERWLYDDRILPAFRTRGGHARFCDAQVAPAKELIVGQTQWRQVGPNGEALGIHGIRPNTARFHLDARNWAKWAVLKLRVRSIKVSPESPPPAYGYQEMPWSRGKKGGGR